MDSIVSRRMSPQKKQTVVLFLVTVLSCEVLDVPILCISPRVHIVLLVRVMSTWRVCQNNGEKPNIIKDLRQRKPNGCNTSARAEPREYWRLTKPVKNAPVLVGFNLEKDAKQQPVRIPQHTRAQRYR